MIVEHVEKATASFIKDANINPQDIESVCTLIPLIQLVWLTPAEIQELNQNSSVVHIEYIDATQKFQTYANNARAIIGGNTFLNAGYTGSNIRVGVIDGGHPRLGTASNSMSYVTNSIGSDREGSGVVDSTFCYNVARNGRRTHFDATEDTSSYSVSAYCDYNDRPFRVAISWYVNSTSSSTQKTDFELEVYKDGELVAYSRAWANSTNYPNTNYEIVSIPAQTYGAGCYEIKIYRSGTFSGPSPNRIGVAWEQRR